MQIANVRLGHATNSSSSHSIIILPDGVDSLSNNPGDQGYYGRCPTFELTEKSSKWDYLAAAFGEQIISQYGEQIGKAIIKEWFEGTPWEEDWYVDHQSNIDLVFDAKTKQISHEFIQDFKNFLARGDVIILGGGDEYDPPDYYAPYMEHEAKLPFIDNWGKMYGNKSGDWWTVYNQYSGAKVRFSFEKNPKPLLRSSMAELVDLKITDYCPFDCGYCYQGSTSRGIHAKVEAVKEYLRRLGSMGVFEVAIGGGEPTFHPNFIEILEYANEVGITPNFTTKRTPDEWEETLLDAVRKYVGGFAVSVRNAREIEDLKAFQSVYFPLNRSDKRRVSIVAHFVVGTDSDTYLKDVIQASKENKIPLTLLGYKETGRGKTYKQYKQYVTPELLKSAGRLSADTCFVEKYAEVIKEAGVDETLIVPNEGQFSMYIDAVSNKAGISSYHTESFVDIRSSYYLQEIWDGFKP